MENLNIYLDDIYIYLPCMVIMLTKIIVITVIFLSLLEMWLEDI